MCSDCRPSGEIVVAASRLRIRVHPDPTYAMRRNARATEHAYRAADPTENQVVGWSETTMKGTGGYFIRHAVLWT
jgi:hypothetical protein